MNFGYSINGRPLKEYLLYIVGVLLQHLTILALLNWYFLNFCIILSSLQHSNVIFRCVLCPLTFHHRKDLRSHESTHQVKKLGRFINNIIVKKNIKRVRQTRRYLSCARHCKIKVRSLIIDHWYQKSVVLCKTHLAKGNLKYQVKNWTVG